MRNNLNDSNNNNNKKEKNKSKATVALLLLVTTLLVASVASAPLTALASRLGDEEFINPTTGLRSPRAPVVVSGDNIYIAWWTNNTSQNGNNQEVMFRVSNDGGATFSDKANLSNSPNSDSWRVDIAAEEENITVTWWETNQTSDIPVARVSNDGGGTFGPLLMLAANGTLSSGEVEEIAVVVDEEGEG